MNKKLLSSLVASVAVTALQAQDIINKKDGSSLNSKVIEIGTEEVKYKKFDFQDGPTYTVRKAEILSIKYSNGQEEIFTEKEKGSKKVFIWGPTESKIDLPKLKSKSPLTLFIEDRRPEPPAKSKVEFTGSQLVEQLSKDLKFVTSGEISFLKSEGDASSSENVIIIRITAYDAQFYPGYWHTQTRYHVKVKSGDKVSEREFESLKGFANTFGQSTAKARLTKSYEEATSQVIEYINSNI